MTQPPADILQRIEGLLRAGKQQEARLLLMEYLKYNLPSARAWWLMSQAVTDLDQQMDCLQRVLRLDPGNEPACERLESLKATRNQATAPSSAVFIAGSNQPATNASSENAPVAPAWASSQTVPRQPALEQKAAPVPTAPVNQPAKGALASSVQPDDQSQTSRASLLPSPESASKGETSGIKKPHSISSCLLEGALMGLVILFAGALLFFAISRGVFDRPADKLPVSKIPVRSATALSVYPTGTFSVAPSRTPTRTPRSTWTPFDTYTPVPTATTISDAVDHWAQVIAQDPENADAYYQRATIYNSATAIGSQDVYISQLDLALQDIDKAISLRSDVGDYYSLRQSVYANLSDNQEYEVDHEYLEKMALDNAYKAYKLGTTIDDYPQRAILIDLIYTNQCQKALDETQKQIAQLAAGDDSLGGLLHIRSQAYACLGRLEDALASVNDSMFNNENIGYKNELKADYLVMLGRYDEALPLFTQMICNCELAGYRYYWRAEIYYNTGKKDLVQNELDTGMPKTWGRGGMLPYVEAQMALDEGRKNDAIKLLQYAEATFSPPENPLRWKVQKMLASLGAPPLKLTPSAPYQATPIH